MVNSIGVLVSDFGALGDGVTDDFSAIQAALDSGASSVVIPYGEYCISNVLRPHKDQHLIINGTLRIADSVRTTLARDVEPGDSQIHVSNASLFKEGDWVTLHDDNLPRQGGGHKLRKQCAGSARIISIKGSVLFLDQSSARKYSIQANAVLARQHSAIWISASGVRISGSGAIDGNKKNQLNAAPGLVQVENSEDWRIGCGIVVKPDEKSNEERLSNIVIEGITVEDCLLHGIVLDRAEFSSVRNLSCSRAHDKNIYLYACRDCRITGCECNDSEWEDGIMLHQVESEQNANVRIMIQGNLCKNNPRYGIHVGHNMREIHLSNNLCVENGLNLSIYGADCTSTGDVASGTTDWLWGDSVYRPNVLIAGRRNSVVNLSALGTRFVALELSGSDISVTGGVLGNMEKSFPESKESGIRVDQGEWGGGCGNFFVVGDCRLGLAIVPEGKGSRSAHAAPDNISVRALQIYGCRVPMFVHANASRVDLSHIQSDPLPDAIEE